MTKPLPTIFIVEDTILLQQMYEMALAGHATIIFATTLAEATEQWQAHGDEIALVVMDACVDNSESIDTMPLIREIRTTFRGPIIATSSVAWYREEMMRDGCSHQAQKNEVPSKVLEVLIMMTGAE